MSIARCSWIPLYLASLGVASSTSTGLLAGMPWLAAGLVGAVAGNLADGWVQLRVLHQFCECLTTRRCTYLVLQCDVAVTDTAFACSCDSLQPEQLQL